MCGRKARMYKIPFEIALAFGGDDNAIKKFLDSLKKVIEGSVEPDLYELRCGRRRNSEEMQRLGIEVGWVDTNRINHYVADCLEVGKILQK